MLKIFLYGKRGAGKSTLIKKLLNDLRLSPSGFCTVSGPTDANGGRGFYIVDAHDGNIDTGERIAHCRPDGSWESYTEVFDVTGVKLLTFSGRPEIVVMDELGFMEAHALKFQSRVLEILGGDIPVIGVVKHMPEPFLQSVISHPSVTAIEVTETNRDGVYNELKRIFEQSLSEAEHV